MKRGDSHEAPHVVAVDLWRQGVLLFIVSAPRSRGGKWRIRRAPDSPITGDIVLVALSWVGNNYFGQEALRRGEAAPPFMIVSGSAPEGNVLRVSVPDALFFIVCLRGPCVRKLYGSSSSPRPWFGFHVYW